MLRKSVSITVLLAFANWLAACAPMCVDLTTEQLVQRQSTSKIVQAHLVSGDTVTFAEAGATMDAETRKVSGNTDSDSSVVLPFDEIESLQVEHLNPKTLELQRSLVDVETLAVRERLEQTQTRRNLTWVQLYSGDTVFFDSTGGIVDIERKIVHGTTENGENTEITLADISSARIGSRDKEAAENRSVNRVLLITGAALVVSFLALLAICSSGRCCGVTIDLGDGEF
jgi:hypothetical protein